MRWRRLLGGLALVALAADARGGEQAAPGDAPPVSAPHPASAVALELLPPGIRPEGERAALRWTRSTEATPGGTRIVELVDGPGAADAGAAAEWLEVRYTIDPELEAGVHTLLEEGGVPLAHVVVMDATTGEVFAYVSTDPETFPAFRAYPTASLMKVVTAAAVLRNRPESASRACRYDGSAHREVLAGQLEPPASGGQVDPFWRAIALSNNQCFARLAVNDVGLEGLLSEMVDVGLFDAPGARHPAGRVEPIEDDLDLGFLGSGLAGSYITPLGAVRLAALLGRGELVHPYWIAELRDAHGTPLVVPAREAPQPVWPPEVADELRELLVAVTERGTARSAFRDADGEPLLGPVQVSGKTGSLSGHDPDGKYRWFVGVAPADAPRVAVAAVTVDGPLSAAHVAARTLRLVFCDEAGCDADRGQQLLARARARGVAARLERTQELERLREMSELDAPPRPIGVDRIEIPLRLRRKRASGEIVLLLELSRKGEVVGIEIDSSDLPGLDEYVTRQVAGWQFTPPTQHGRPVQARARLRIPIEID